MRPNVAISGLLACSIGISAAPNDGPGLTVPRPNSIVTIQYSETPLPNPPVIPRSSSLAFEFTTDGATINTVKLKIYDSTGRDNGNGDDDQTIANVTFPTFVSTSGPDRNVMLNLDERGTGIVPMLLTHGNDSISIEWVNGDNLTYDYHDKPLYLECEWTKSPNSGNSTSQLFAVYDDDEDKIHVLSILEGVRGRENVGAPARSETVSSTPTSPTPLTSPEVSASPTSGTTGQPASTAGALSPSSLRNPGLNRNGIIGVAVGVTVGVLLVAGTLVWWFCFHRRRRTTAHHAMPSYASDVGVHAMMHDKEIPVALESSSPRSAYGSGGDEGRPSADHYVPYSDRSVTSPTPDHHRTASNTTAPAPAPAAAAAAVGATSQTDPSRGGRRGDADACYRLAVRSPSRRGHDGRRDQAVGGRRAATRRGDRRRGSKRKLRGASVSGEEVYPSREHTGSDVPPL
ncbi:hypothetical protein CIB48_g1104 [Xylaria polymorpha]|nr:hypothetical protein CIB48_g1104 [Xylaria polymorpha]